MPGSGHSRGDSGDDSRSDSRGDGRSDSRTGSGGNTRGDSRRGGAGHSGVTRSTLRQQIADALRDEVLAGRLPAGRHVAVKEIAEQYGVSATPVREALVDLSAQGLVDLEHHRGFAVHRFTPDDFRSMIEARVLIVDGIFRCATDRLLSAVTPRALASVRRRAEEAERASRAGDLDILIGYDLRFWRELGHLVGNPYISDLLDRVRVQSWAFAVPYLRRAGDLRGRLWSGHSELVETVESRDPAAAQRIIAECNDHALRLLDELMRADAAGD
ncbi:GntR family transcriptional regulator [Streptomyces sp. NPDC004647]|uniref:GntR family transcriptional regulator n=1 Tax=Streptomyces sp. NPDC004647 TaxID=3154671 RepID=UPI0033A2F6DE